MGLSFPSAEAQTDLLTIQQASQSQLRISWPSGLQLVQPQRATSLSAEAWQDFGASTAANEVTDTTASGWAFYRLRFLAPSITAPPLTQAVSAGGNVTLTVAASGTAPISFQWRRNGAELAGQTNAALALNNFAANDAGDFAVVLRNRAGSITSSVAALTISAPAVVPRGIWMGMVAGQTNGGFAMLVKSNSAAIALGYSPAQSQSILLTNFTVGSAGTFRSPLNFGASVSGDFGADLLAGSLVATNGTTNSFSAARKSESGIQQANAGFYAGRFEGLLSGEVFLILAADGASFAYLLAPIVSGGAFGMIDAANNFSATVAYTFPGATAPSTVLISGKLNPATHQFTGSYGLLGLTLGTISLSRVTPP